MTGIVGGVLLLSIFLAVKRVPLGDAATIFYSGNSWFIRHFEFDMKGKVYLYSIFFIISPSLSQLSRSGILFNFEKLPSFLGNPVQYIDSIVTCLINVHRVMS